MSELTEYAQKRITEAENNMYKVARNGNAGQLAAATRNLINVYEKYEAHLTRNQRAAYKSLIRNL